jgi:hypothetical protein
MFSVNRHLDGPAVRPSLTPLYVTLRPSRMLVIFAAVEAVCDAAIETLTIQIRAETRKSIEEKLSL